jgi:hypothetical protein
MESILRLFGEQLEVAMATLCGGQNMLADDTSGFL